MFLKIHFLPVFGKQDFQDQYHIFIVINIVAIVITMAIMLITMLIIINPELQQLCGLAHPRGEALAYFPGCQVRY